MVNQIPTGGENTEAKAADTEAATEQKVPEWELARSQGSVED